MADPGASMSTFADASRRGAYAGPVGCLTLAGSRLPLVSPARVYVCGITPYDVTHLGHAATFVWADVAVRVLHATGVEVITCRNVTDVDDVLTRAAAERGRYYDEFAATQEFMFDRAMRHLRVASPTLAPRAGQHVREVVQLGAALLQLDRAYERDGSVYFRGQDVPVAAGLDQAEALRLMQEYGDDTEDQAKDSPFDVPVWVRSGEGDPAWPSPWGPGRPGWHAECAAMAVGSLGHCIDLLAGGADLTFPHHAYQSALVTAFNGAGRFARVTFDVGTVRVNGAKMAKSTGNLVLVEELLADVSPEQLRLLLIDRPWAEPWDFDRAGLAAAGERLERLYAAAARPSTADATPEIMQALCVDLDVPAALRLADEAGGAGASALLRLLALDRS